MNRIGGTKTNKLRISCRPRSLRDSSLTFSATFPRRLYFTATTEVLWMDFMTAARRLHRSWAWLTCTLGGSLRITVSAEPSRTLGRNSPSLTCRESGKRRSRSAQVDFSRNVMNSQRMVEMIVPNNLQRQHKNGTTSHSASQPPMHHHMISACTAIKWRGG